MVMLFTEWRSSRTCGEIKSSMLNGKFDINKFDRHLELQTGVKIRDTNLEVTVDDI